MDKLDTGNIILPLLLHLLEGEVDDA